MKIRIGLFILFLLLTQNLLFAAEATQLNTHSGAENFTLLDLTNKKFSLSDFKNQPVMLFFWTIGCPYCRKELKLLNTMQEELLNNGIQLFAINAGESAEKVQRFFKASPPSFRVLLDIDTKVSESYGIIGVPTYIFINKDGRIVFDDHYFPEKEYKGIILK